MSNLEKEAKFLSELMIEKRQAQKRRGKLISLKLSWVMGLFSVGAIKFPTLIESQSLLYFVPIVALVFDLYILGENYGIKRMGTFVRLKFPTSIDEVWETWLGPRRDKFSWYALPLSSYVILAACATILFYRNGNPQLFGTWLIGIAALMFVVFFTSAKSLRRLDELKEDDVF